MSRAAADDRSRGKSYSNAKRGSAARRHSHSGGIGVIQVRDCQSNPFLLGGVRGAILFPRKENGPPYTPQEKGIRLAVSDLNDSYASGMGMPARGGAAFSVAIRLASASIIRCRSAHLVGVQPNSRLPPASSMRRAQQCRILQAVCRQTTVTRASR